MRNSSNTSYINSDFNSSVPTYDSNTGTLAYDSNHNHITYISGPTSVNTGILYFHSTDEVKLKNSDGSFVTINLEDNSIYIDGTNDTLVILNKTDLKNCKVNKIESIDFEAEIISPVKYSYIKKNKTKQLNLKFANKQPDGSFYQQNYFELFDRTYNTNGLFCNVCRGKDNILLDIKNSIAYICDGENWTKYSIKNFNVKISTNKSVNELFEERAKRKLLTEKIVDNHKKEEGYIPINERNTSFMYGNEYIYTGTNMINDGIVLHYGSVDAATGSFTYTNE